MSDKLQPHGDLDESRSSAGRREFLKSTAALGALSMIGPSEASGVETEPSVTTPKSLIGGYGHWAAGLAEDPPRLSFRRNQSEELDAWRRTAQAKTRELIASPNIGGVPQVTIHGKHEFDGLEIEELSWQLPFGHATQAVFLKPKHAKGPLPAILGLHDHGGNKYFGKRKITKTSERMHPMMVAHQKASYEGLAWANEVAKRGFSVLVHDVFAFASRRVLFAETCDIPWGGCATDGKSDQDPEDQENIDSYNTWASDHEAIMAKALFSAGTTWPGVFLAEDQRALDVLSNRDDVDSARLGCAGLSGGGLRTVYLGGLDARIKCAVCVGFLSTWKDFLLNKCFTHTWMTYTPLLPNYLDFPEILGLRAPLPTMSLNNNEDSLYTLPEMKRADRILQEVYAKAGGPDRYQSGFYPGGHKFDRQMQRDAFNWFDRWLKQ